MIRLILKDMLQIVAALLVLHCLLHYLFKQPLIVSLVLLIPACTFLSLSCALKITLLYRLKSTERIEEVGPPDSGYGVSRWAWIEGMRIAAKAAKGGHLAGAWYRASLCAAITAAAQVYAIGYLAVKQNYVIGVSLAIVSLVALLAMAKPSMRIMVEQPRFRRLMKKDTRVKN